MSFFDEKMTVTRTKDFYSSKEQLRDYILNKQDVSNFIVLLKINHRIIMSFNSWLEERSVSAYYRTSITPSNQRDGMNHLMSLIPK